MQKLENILIMKNIMSLINLGRTHNVCEKVVIEKYLNAVEQESKLNPNPYEIHESANKRVINYIRDYGE